MHLDDFWTMVESARGDQRPTHEALVDRLSGGSPVQILDFQSRFDEMDDLVHRWDVWAAAYLIGGGCSDDSFSDFRAGLIALGREWFERVVQSPDSLADHSAVIDAASEGNHDAVFYELFQNAASSAYERRTGDKDAFWAAMEKREDGRVGAD